MAVALKKREWIANRHSPISSSNPFSSPYLLLLSPVLLKEISMAPSRFDQLDAYHSKVTAQQLKALHQTFDIPKEYKLSAPVRSASIYHHGEGRDPLYIAHLECGLRLPMAPFLRKVFDALGISPMQMKPNSIGILVGFTVICKWLGIVPSLRVLSHLVNLVVQNDPHCHLQMVGDPKIVTHLPSSHKDWKSKFVWVEGDDSNLGCTKWLPVSKNALTAVTLSADEQRDLDQVRAYVGARKLACLVDNSVLRILGMSAVIPREEDKDRANMLSFGLLVGTPGASEGESSGGSGERQASPPPDVRAAGSDQGGDEGGTSESSDDVPLIKRQRRHYRGDREAEGTSSRQEIVRVDLEAAPGPAAPVGSLAVVEAEDRLAPPMSEATEEGAQSIQEGPPRREGKGPVETAEPASTQLDWPHPHFVADADEASWIKARSTLLGATLPGSRNRDEPAAGRAFEPLRRLDSQWSVLESRSVQAKAVEQYWLPRDADLMREIPDMGLHLILRSYLVRGSLIEQEMHRRLSLAYENFAKLKERQETRPSEEKMGVDEVEVAAQLSAKEAELDEWRREVKAREEMMEGLRSAVAEKTAEAERLKEALTRANDMLTTMNRVYQEKEHVEEQLMHEQEISESTWLQLEATKEDMVRVQEENSRLQERVTYLESEEYRDQVVRDHRFSALGRLEMLLTCKAGFDFLKTQLPSELRNEPGRLHPPPVIAPHLEFLSNLEGEGGGYNVEGNEMEAEGGAPEEVDGVQRDEETTEDRGERSTGGVGGGDREQKDSSPPSITQGSAPL